MSNAPKSAGRRRRPWLVAAVVVLVVAVVALYELRGYRDQRQAGPADPERLARGAEIYAEACASCHGAELEGEPNWQVRKEDGRLPAPPHDASGHTWHHADQVLFELTKLGTAALVGGGYESDMPGFADSLSDDEIWAVLAFIKSQWPEEIRRRQAEINAAAESQ